MGCHARCKSCNTNLYLQEQKDELRFPISIMCFTCNNTNTYNNYEVVQERRDFKCLFCSRFFFIKRSPPLSISCPHCKSNIYINFDGSQTLVRNGIMPEKDKDTAKGLIGGAAIGALFGPAGAILGGLLGAAIGNEGLSQEANYHNGI